MKSLTILIAALVVTLILNGPIQSYADPQLDTLVNIATQARSNLNISISQISNVPSEIISLYKQGSDETDALTTAANTQNVTSAKQHFLAAMNFFKTTNDKINSLNATETNDQQRMSIIQLQSEITRLEKIAETLQTIAITNHVDFNFTQFNTSLTEAKQDLDIGKIEEASKSLDTANRLIIDAHHSLSEVAQQRTTDRAKDFTEKQIERFDKIRDLNTTQNIPMSVFNVTMSKTNSNLTSTENPGDMIAKLRKLASEGNVNEALKIIKSLDAYQKETLKNNENQIESQSQTSVNIQNNTETSSNPITTNLSNVTTTNTTVANTSNVTITNPPITNKSNVTNANPAKINSFRDENSSTNTSNVTETTPIMHPSNITTTNHVKTDSSNNENSSQPNKDGKIDKTNSLPDNNFNQQGKDNKTEFQVIPQGSFDSEQQNKTHEKNHEKILEKQKIEKQNHD